MKEPLQYRVLEYLQKHHSVWVKGIETYPELDFDEAMTKLNNLTNFELLELLSALAESEKTP